MTRGKRGGSDRAAVVRGIAAAVLAASIAVCGPGDRPASAPVDGRNAYTIRCSYCHDVPNGIGAELTPRVLAAYSTVGALDRYLRFAMPQETPGSLPTEEYAAILAYLIESRELVEAEADAEDLPPSTRLRASEPEPGGRDTSSPTSGASSH